MKIQYSTEVATTRLGKAIREHRGNFSLREASAISGIGFQTLHRIERGFKPDIENFRACMLWLGIPVKEWSRYMEFEVR